jgi:hypothetical protein
MPDDNFSQLFWQLERHIASNCARPIMAFNMVAKRDRVRKHCNYAVEQKSNNPILRYTK